MQAVNSMMNTLPPVQTVIDSSQLVEVPCFTSLPRSDMTPLDFRIDRTDQHINTSNVYLYVKCIIEVDAEEDTAESCSNNLAYSMWQNVEMYINDQKVTQDQNLYPWMAYLVCMTRYSKQYRETALVPSLWAPDMYGTMDGAKTDNTGYARRKNYITDGAFELYSRVMLDFIHLPRLLPKQTEVMYRFIPAVSTSFLIGTGSPRLKIQAARLYVGREKLTTCLPKQMSYPVSRFSARSRIVNTGEQNMDWVPFTGKRPRRLFVMQILQQTYNANIAYNLFNLQTFDLKQIQVYFNDLSLPTNVATTLGKNDVLRCYFNTMKAIDSPLAWDIIPEAYGKGYFIYAVDLTNDHSASSEYRSAVKHGSIRLRIDYNEPLTEAIAVLCFAEFDDMLTIDGDGNPSWT